MAEMNRKVAIRCRIGGGMHGIESTIIHLLEVTEDDGGMLPNILNFEEQWISLH